MSGRSDLSESLTQEAFVRVIESRDRFDPSRSFRAWLYTIARNLLRDEWKRQSRSPLVDQELDEAMNAGAAPGPEELAVLSEERGRLLQAIARLPANQREVLMLHEFDRLTHREIAEMRGEPAGTIRSQFFYALNALRSAL